MKLLVRNLDRATTEADLRALFEPFGAIQSCRLVLDSETGLSKGFGFIEMPKVGDAKAAIQRLNGFTVDGKSIRVKKAETPAPAADSDVEDV
ncbi:MAG: RNA-binding protein [unclassified Hahellaceae]|nr:RNA-binding protein [Hahellaceae bacterium]